MKPKIALVSKESKKGLSGFEANFRLLTILEPLSCSITWISTNCDGDRNKIPENTNWINLTVKEKYEAPFWKRIIPFLKYQQDIIRELNRIKDADIFIYWYGGDLYLFSPFLFTTLFLKKKTILKIDGRSSVLCREQPVRGIGKIPKSMKVLLHTIKEIFLFSRANIIAVQFEYMIERYRMQKYQHKIKLANQYVDTMLFKKSKEWLQRAYPIGYCGRLSKEKGILEFSRALPAILKDPESKAIIIGDGDLKDEVKNLLAANNIDGRVELTGWIDIEMMPDYLNDIKILIVPSYIEGIPKIIVEAMACGSVVLASHSGGIPEIIKDGKTGFLMENNSAECIEANIRRAFNHPNITEITRNARDMIEKKFSYVATLERYQNIINSML